MAKIFPWTEIEAPEYETDYRWDCIDTEITELPDIISWCKEGLFNPTVPRIGINISSHGNVFRYFNSAPSIDIFIESGMKKTVDFNATPALGTNIISDISSFAQEEASIISATDDGMLYSAGVFVTAYPPNSSFQLLGNTNGRGWSFQVFNNVQIPYAAVITRAFVRHTSRTNSVTKANTQRMYFEQADNPIAPIDAGDLTGRVLGNEVEWTMVPWSQDVVYDSPDLTSIIQPIFNRAGWTPGNSINFISKTDRAGSGDNYNTREAWSYDGSVTKSSKLIIEFEGEPLLPDDDFTGDDFDTPNTTKWSVGYDQVGDPATVGWFIHTNELYGPTHIGGSGDLSSIYSNGRFVGDFDITLEIPFYSGGSRSNFAFTLLNAVDGSESQGARLSVLNWDGARYYQGRSNTGAGWVTGTTPARTQNTLQIRVTRTGSDFLLRYWKSAWLTCDNFIGIGTADMYMKMDFICTVGTAYAQIDNLVALSYDSYI